MKTLGIVSEFNPFHNGHAALCGQARRQGADFLIAAMSGNFVQRGDVAILDKRVRARAALLGGVDLVVELPLPWAMATAQTFARGAVALLQAAGADGLCFGSECGDIALLRRTAEAVGDPAVRERTRANLTEGITFARARQQAAESLYGPEIGSCLASPNNILAVEYLVQMKALGWDGEAVTIRRVGAEHDSRGASGGIASASHLRRHPEQWAGLVPPEALAHYQEAFRLGQGPSSRDRLDRAVLAHLRRLSPRELRDLPDLSEGLEDRLYKAIRSASSLAELEAAVKTKRYPMARVRRLVLGAFLCLRREDAAGTPPYLRLLGFNARGRELLGRRQERGLPVHASLARLEALGDGCARTAALEALAGDLYALCLPRPPACGYEYTASAVFLKNN